MLKMILLACLFGFASMAIAQKTTSIAATMDGYSGKYVMFEFMQNPTLNKRYDYIANNPMDLEFELDDVELVKVNQWVWIILEPGDKIDVSILFEGRTYKDTKFTGTKSAVEANELALAMRNSRIKKRYKMNPLAAFAVQTKIEDYAVSTLAQWEVEKNMLLSNENKLSKAVYDYLYSELEATFLSNYIKYPSITAGNSIERFKEVAPADYCSALANLSLRDNPESLRSHMYMAFLLDYKDYKDRCAAIDGKGNPIGPENLKAYYDSLVNFYQGRLRDAAIFVFLYNSITAEKDFDIIERLVQDYIQKHNKDASLKILLEGMLK